LTLPGIPSSFIQVRAPSFRRAALLLLAALFALLGACDKPRPNEYQGYAEGEFVYIASPLGGRLDRLEVRRGQTVAANAPLFALDAELETAAKHEAGQRWKAAQAQLADIRTGKRLPEVEVIQAQLAQAEAQAQNAEAQLRRDEAQFAAGGVSQAALDERRTAATSLRARVLELKAQVAVAHLPNREQQIHAQEAQVEAAAAALAQADWSLRQKTVFARQDGLVFDTLYREGEWVAAGAPVVKLLPPQNVKARFFVPEKALGALSPGQRVQLSCDACPRPIAARISYIAQEAEYTPPVIYSNDNRAKLVYLVEAHPEAHPKADSGASGIPSPLPPLNPGQPLTVTLDSSPGNSAQ